MIRVAEWTTFSRVYFVINRSFVWKCTTNSPNSMDQKCEKLFLNVNKELFQGLSVRVFGFSIGFLFFFKISSPVPCPCWAHPRRVWWSSWHLLPEGPAAVVLSTPFASQPSRSSPTTKKIQNFCNLEEILEKHRSVDPISIIQRV